MGLRGRSGFGRDGLTFFVTTTVVHFAKIFTDGEMYYEILAASLNHQFQEHKAKLLAYVFMPSHLHFIVTLPEGESLSDFMRDFKKFTSTRVRQQLEQERKDQLLMTLRRNARGKRNQVFKLWMDRFDDLIIENDKTLIIKMNYIHYNPVKAGLTSRAEEWKYSSAQDYLGRKNGPLPVCVIGLRTDFFLRKMLISQLIDFSVRRKLLTPPIGAVHRQELIIRRLFGERPDDKRILSYRRCYGKSGCQ